MNYLHVANDCLKKSSKRTAFSLHDRLHFLPCVYCLFCKHPDVICLLSFTGEWPPNSVDSNRFFSTGGVIPLRDFCGIPSAWVAYTQHSPTMERKIHWTTATRFQGSPSFHAGLSSIILFRIADPKLRVSVNQHRKRLNPVKCYTVYCVKKLCIHYAST